MLKQATESVTINITICFSEMDSFTDDVLSFAEHLGFKGIDSDLFYESYYQLDNEEYEYDYDGTIEECYDSYS